MTFFARMAFILNLQRQYLAFKYTPLSHAGMGGGSLLFKYHYNTKLKDGNYSIPTKETSRRRPLATVLGSLKLFLSTSRRTEEKQKGRATVVAVFIIGLRQHRHTQTQVSVLTTFPSRHLPKSRPGRPLSTELRRYHAGGQRRGRAGEDCAAPRSFSPYPGPPSAPAQQTRAHPAHRGFSLRLQRWGPPPGGQDADR